MNVTEYVATFIAPDRLPSELLPVAAGSIIDQGGVEIDCDVIADDNIAEIIFRGGDTGKISAHFALLAEAHVVDIIVQPVATRRKKLLVADMESTVIEQEMVDELAAQLGIGEKVAAITRRSMNGEIDFVASLRERVALLKGQPVLALDTVAKRITFMPGAEALLKAMRKNGAASWLVTGGFTYFARPVAERLGFTRVFANELVIKNGALTGELVEPVLDRKGKRTMFEKACQELGITAAEAVAIGDGANDLDMLTACNAGGGLGIAYHAKPAVRAAVPHQINYTDLTALLYAQGYN